MRSRRIDTRMHSRVWAMVRDNEALMRRGDLSLGQGGDVETRARLYPTVVRILDALSSNQTLTILASMKSEDLRAGITNCISLSPEDSYVLIERIVLWLRPVRRRVKHTRFGALDIPADEVDAAKIIDATSDYPAWIRQHPQAVTEWDWVRNPPERDPWAPKGMMPKAWWVCASGHSWDASPSIRGARKTNCRYCARLTIWPGLDDLGTLFPEIAAEWDHGAEMNAGHHPDRVNPSVHLAIMWVCSAGHRWPRTIRARTTNPAGCPECQRKREQTVENKRTSLQNHVSHRSRTIVPGVNDLATTHPHLALEWAPTNPTEIAEVARWTPIAVLWVCRLGHNWRNRVDHRCARGSGCPVCSGRTVVASVNDLASHHPNLVEEWDLAPAANDRGPDEVTVSSAYVAGWRCRSGHTWRARVDRRSRGRGHRCPECFGRHSPRSGRTLARLRPDLALQWDEDNEHDPTELSSTSRYIATWRCASSHHWRSEVVRRVLGEGCPDC